MTEEQKQSGLPALYNITKQQAWVAGIPAGASVIADIASHANPGVMFVGGLLALAIGVSSKEVTEMLIPGSNPDQVRAGLSTIVQAVTPEVEEEYVDQRALSKLRRLLHVGTTPDLYETQDIVLPGAVVAQPKDDLRRVVVDVSEEDEYIWDGDEEIIPVTTPGHTGGLFTFSHVLDTGFIPTLKKIYVGSTEEGIPLFVEAKDLCHVALGGNTGGGKTSLIRMLMAQLCKAGATVYLLNPHYTVYDREHDEDWTPFTPYLKEDPLMCSEYDKIEYYLEQLAGPVLRKRIDLVKAGQLPGKPCFLIIDELPAIVKECAKNVPGFMEKLLREGRKYGIFLIVGSQDFLVKTIGTEGGAVRQCFRTGYYVGGDPTTARNLLEQGIAIPETRLGKGIAMLRCAATKKTIIAKVPYVDNASLYRLLGPSTFFQSPPSRKSTQPAQVLPDLFDEEESKLSMHDLCEAVLQMAEMHYKNGEIMHLLEMSEREYRAAVDYIRSHWSEFNRSIPTSVPTSQASSVPTSNSTSIQSSKLRLVNGHEGSNEVGRSGLEVENTGEVGTSGNFELTEREIRMGEMFFVERVGINVIMKEFFPGVTGGDRYQKASAEINDALRKYVEVKRGA